MGLFSFTQELAMDLGTANTIITCNDKMVVDEPSVIALDARSEKVLAVGRQAREMYEKTNPNIRTIRPLREGVIADFYAAEQMMRGLIKMASGRKRWFAPSLRMVIGIPSGSTEVEIRAVRDSAEHAGGREVYMVFEPMAAAIGVGMDVLAPEGNMIVDIGGGTTEIAVISLGGIVSNKSIKMAGDDLTNDIVEYMRRQHNIRVSERMAERIKINVGSALSILEDAPEDFEVCGPNQMTALPMKVPVSYQEIAHCLDKSISKIEAAVLSALEQTPPELYADIVKNGIYLAGGREVYMVFEPMAAAIGVGMDVLAPEGNMIVDIGGGTTEIAVISLGGIVSNKSIKMAGDDLTNDIVEYMRRQHNIRVSERMAERIKINVGSALSILEDAPEDFEVCGPNQMTALPMKVPVSYQEIAHCLDKSISKIEAAVLSALEQTPPELYADIVKNGIYLAGGGALLRGIDKRLRDKMGIEFHVADDPLHAVARGTGIALKNIDKFNFLIR